MIMNNSRPPKPKRRWYQFSLRILLVFMLVCGAGLGWLAMKMQRAKRQRENVKAIRMTGGMVLYDYEFDDTGRFIPGAQPTAPVWLRKTLGNDFFCDVIDVNLNCTQVTDAGLEHLNIFTSLRWLELHGTQVTDAGLEHLKTLTGLIRLQLGETQVTDAGLVHLKGLTSLEVLYLGHTRVTDAGLEHLKEFTSLEELHLWNTRVTDAGLDHLKRLTKLQRLDLTDTDVTDEGIRTIQAALPNCQIVGEKRCQEPFLDSPRRARRS